MLKSFYPLNEKIPLSKAFLSIFLSILMISGVVWMGWLYYVHLKRMRLNDEQYRIVNLTQWSPQKEGLSTSYLAELLKLSPDQPVNLYQFDKEEGVRRLLASPMIKSGSIKKIVPGTLYVEYEMRKPEAFLGNYENTLIDYEGYIFPYRPFFVQRSLPMIHLGFLNRKPVWGESILDDERTVLAFELLKHLRALFTDETSSIKYIDVSQAFSENYGKREIIVRLEERKEDYQNGKKILRIKPVILRLNPDHYKQNMMNFMTLKHFLNEQQTIKKIQDKILTIKETLMMTQPMTIDLRIDHLAFIKNSS